MKKHLLLGILRVSSRTRAFAIVCLAALALMPPAGAAVYSITENDATETFTLSPDLAALNPFVIPSAPLTGYGPGAHIFLLNVFAPSTIGSGTFIVPEPGSTTTVNIVTGVPNQSQFDGFAQLQISSDVSTSSPGYAFFLAHFQGPFSDIIVSGPNGSAPFEFFDSVPDGGSSVAMLSFALAGWVGLRRKLGK
jgi:hypothetical protein